VEDSYPGELARKLWTMTPDDESEARDVERPIRKKAASRDRTSFDAVSRNPSLDPLAGVDPIESWVPTYLNIVSLREQANRENLAAGETRGRPFFTDQGANYLAQVVSRVLEMNVISALTTPRDWIRSHPDQIVVVDARRVLVQYKDTLEKAPQAAIRGRLHKMASYFPEADAVTVLRVSTAVCTGVDGESIDPRFAVALYRRA